MYTHTEASFKGSLFLPLGVRALWLRRGHRSAPLQPPPGTSCAVAVGVHPREGLLSPAYSRPASCGWLHGALSLQASPHTPAGRSCGARTAPSWWLAPPRFLEQKGNCGGSPASPSLARLGDPALPVGGAGTSKCCGKQSNWPRS